MSIAAPILLTPGPLTTSARTRQAMMVDWGSWDDRFNQLTASLCEQLLAILNGADSHHCVPLQGSGTFAVEAAIGTLVPRDGKVLVLINGAYGKRLAKICEVLGRSFSTFETAEDEPTTAADVDRLLRADAGITHVALIHCETSTGILNPLPEIAHVIEQHGKRLIIDAMSSFGALAGGCAAGAVRCTDRRLGQMPGRRAGHGFRLRSQRSPGQCRWQLSFAGDGLVRPAHLHGQDRPMALHPADPRGRRAARSPAAIQRRRWLAGRHERYAANCQALMEEMAKLGLRSFLPAAIQAPIIATFHAPKDPRYEFKAFYERVKAKGYILYPGKLTQVETFRVGCIGHVTPAQMREAVAAIAEVLREMEVLEI
jgi:2-aminoethylphosphonate-pyruvate transaminase